MAYTSNPQMPRVRAEAVRLVKSGWSTRKVARHLGFTQSVIVKWVARAPRNRKRLIVTRSSRPHHHPHEISKELADLVIEYRKQYERDAFSIHHMPRRKASRYRFHR